MELLIRHGLDPHTSIIKGHQSYLMDNVANFTSIQ